MSADGRPTGHPTRHKTGRIPEPGTLGWKIRQERNQQGLSQTELGVVVGASQRQVTRWELNEGFPIKYRKALMRELPGLTDDDFSGQPVATYGRLTNLEAEAVEMRDATLTLLNVVRGLCVEVEALGGSVPPDAVDALAQFGASLAGSAAHGYGPELDYRPVRHTPGAP